MENYKNFTETNPYKYTAILIKNALKKNGIVLNYHITYHKDNTFAIYFSRKGEKGTPIGGLDTIRPLDYMIYVHIDPKQFELIHKKESINSFDDIDDCVKEFKYYLTLDDFEVFEGLFNRKKYCHVYRGIMWCEGERVEIQKDGRVCTIIKLPGNPKYDKYHFMDARSGCLIKFESGETTWILLSYLRKIENEDDSEFEFGFDEKYNYIKESEEYNLIDFRSIESFDELKVGDIVYVSNTSNRPPSPNLFSRITSINTSKSQIYVEYLYNKKDKNYQDGGFWSTPAYVKLYDPYDDDNQFEDDFEDDFDDVNEKIGEWKFSDDSVDETSIKTILDLIGYKLVKNDIMNFRINYSVRKENFDILVVIPKKKQKYGDCNLDQMRDAIKSISAGLKQKYLINCKYDVFKKEDNYLLRLLIKKADRVAGTIKLVDDFDLFDEDL